MVMGQLRAVVLVVVVLALSRAVCVASSSSSAGMGVRWVRHDEPVFVQEGASKWDLGKAFTKGIVTMECPHSVRLVQGAERERERKKQTHEYAYTLSASVYLSI